MSEYTARDLGLLFGHTWAALENASNPHTVVDVAESELVPVFATDPGVLVTVDELLGSFDDPEEEAPDFWRGFLDGVRAFVSISAVRVELFRVSEIPDPRSGQ